MMRRKERVRLIAPGDQFGALTIIARAEPRGKSQEIWWLCRCSCGREEPLASFRLRSGERSSCRLCGRNHGLTKTTTHSAWRGMRRRCMVPHSPGYEYYGGRGIKVCERWMEFRVFLADMGECPSGHTLDRINRNGDYEPGNCRWATWTEQMRNSGSTKLSADDVRNIKRELASGALAKDIAPQYGVNPATISNIRRGKTWGDVL